MTDDDLMAKARALVEPVLPGRAAELDRACGATGTGWVPALLAAGTSARWRSDLRCWSRRSACG